MMEDTPGINPRRDILEPGSGMGFDEEAEHAMAVLRRGGQAPIAPDEPDDVEDDDVEDDDDDKDF